MRSFFSTLVVLMGLCGLSGTALAQTVTLTAPANGASYTLGNTVNLTATKTGVTVTKIRFKQNGTVISTDSTSPYTASFVPSTAGSYALVAEGLNSSNVVLATSATATITVTAANAAPTVSLTSPSNGATATAPGSFTLSANASDSDGSIASVKFYAGATLLNTDTTAPYSYAWTNVAAGSYSLTAVATDNAGATTTSSAVNVTVTAPNVAPTVSLTSPSNGASTAAPGSFTLNANASDSDGTVSRVDFYYNGNLIGTDTSAPYSVNWTNVAAGSYSLTAVATDNASATTTSSAVSVTVTSTPTAISLTRTYVYDQYERLCVVINPESGATILDYDAAGNIAWSADGQTASGTTATSCAADRAAVPANAKTTRTYDAMNRVTAVSTPGGTADVVTTYTADGLVASLTAANPGGNNVTTTYTYNQRRLLIGETSTPTGLSAYSLAYGYNANGHLASLTYPDAETVQYAPDALGRATQVASPGNATYASNITYYPNGAIAGFTYGNGIVHTLTKNARHLPSRSQDWYCLPPSAPNDPLCTNKAFVLDDTYTFDANGNVTDITDQAQAGLTTRGMAYDGLDRLTTAVAPSLWGNATYSYDALDNLRSADLGTRLYRYSYDAASNRLLNIKNPSGVLQFAFTYDARGNTTAKGSQGYVFDAANRLNQVTGIETYRYDGQGRRVTVVDADSKLNRWLYSQSGQVLYNGDARRRQNLSYIYLGNSQVATRSWNWDTSVSTIRYQHTDSLGSIVAETDVNKNVVVRNKYEPYGNAFNSVIDGTGYTGHVMDRATGLTYMQQRYYDPSIGRFLSVDPARSEFNLYSYASNNPYRYYDPDGRASIGAGSSRGPQNGNTCQEPSGCYPPPDPMDDPNRPTGCGTARNCWRDNNGKWHTDGPGPVDVYVSEKKLENGTRIIYYKSRKMTDQEARAIFKMAGFPNASSRRMDQSGRDLATAIYWHIKSTSRPMRYLQILVNEVAGGEGGSLAQDAFELISFLSNQGNGKLDVEKNYAELFAEFGQGAISAAASSYRDDYDDWAEGQ